MAITHPNRPNPIGLSLVRLLDREGKVLRVESIDVLDGTPLINTKPYVPSLDRRNTPKIGWVERKT